MKKVIGYIRVSTDKQVNNGISPEAQIEKIEQWSSLNEHSLVKIYSDGGISGKKVDNRPGLREALDALGEGDALVAYSMSRIARSVRDTIAISDMIDKKKANLVMLTDQIDTTTPQGKLYFHIMASLNQYQRDLVSSHVAEIMAYKRDRGEKTGGKVPFGFDVVEESHGDKAVKKIMANEDEQETIEAIRMMAGKKWSAGKIARRLNQEGIKTKCEKEWTKTQVLRLIGRLRRANLLS